MISSITQSSATNSVLKNTFLLLSATLLFSTLAAYFSVKTSAHYYGPWITIGVYFVLLLLTNLFKDSVLGILFTFGITGWLGWTLGPVLSQIITLHNGTFHIVASLGLTALIFLSLSLYAITTKKDFSYLGSFLGISILVAFLAGIAAMIFHLPGLSLLVSAAFVILSSGLILYQVSEIINGGETNYIMATVQLYVSIFVSLLQLFTGFDD